MNLALSAILLIVLLLPGATAIRSYYSAFKAKQANVAMPFNDLLLKGLVISLLAHTLSIWFITRLCKGDVQLNILYDIIAGKDIKISDQDLATILRQFFTYNAILVVAGWILAKLVKRIVQVNNWDLNFFSLRSMNYWYILFTARYLEGRGVEGEQKKIDLVFLDVLTNGNIIYSGILYDFNYSPQKDELENLVLKSTIKRNFNQTEEEKEHNPDHSTGDPCSIPGDVFVVPLSSVINININYIEIEENAD